MINVRLMQDSDCKLLSDAFSFVGVDRSIETFINYYVEQQNKKRLIFVATIDDELCGYGTLSFMPQYDHFKFNNIVEIKDLNVLPQYLRKGVATAIVEFAEKLLQEFYENVGVAVPVLKDYAPAHTFFARRAYFPDGNGLCYNEKVVNEQAELGLDPNLVLYYVKKLK